MSASAIARRYAKALVQLGAEEGAIDGFQQGLIGFESLLKESNALRAVLSNPAYGIEAKREILKDVITRLNLPGTVGNCLLLLLDRNRLGCLSQIVTCYGAMADELSGIIRPVITSAMPLDDGQVSGIRDAMTKMTGKQVHLKVEVDPSLIGGVVTKIGDKMFDGSVKTQLTRIEDILQKG